MITILCTIPVFASGIVKLLSGCPEWRSLNAMALHFETQPLPNIGGYYAHNLFKGWTKLLTLSVYFVELVVPFLIFGGAFLRFTAALLFMAFQLLIMGTGNYAFFNILTIALSFTLIDNQYLQWLPNFTIEAWPPIAPFNFLLNGIAILLIALNIMQLFRIVWRLKSLDQIFYIIAPFHLMNAYGLFAVMTTKRNEIILEGSEDGVVWKAYEFNWKPAALDQHPKQIAPLQPRLDWQMWFASLSHYQHAPWFHQLLARLLQGSSDVTALFKTNPFQENPPKYIRALFYEYRFTTLKEKSETGHWWKRNYLGFYSPPFSLTKE